MTAEESRLERLAWFREARVGMFIHWGASSLLPLEQALYRDLMPLAEYEPVAQQFKPAAGWADDLAKQARDAGLRYAVLTTRHHDGYCLFDTDTTDFTAPRTGPGRDLVAEFVTAFRAQGLRVGLYYSLLNWRWPGYWSPDQHADDWPRMVDEIHAQVRSLMTHYGPIDLLWYDGAMVPGEGGHGMWGGKPIDCTAADFFRSSELNAMVRSLQPAILINNRSGVREDFGTPEQYVAPEDGGQAWETCMTINFAPGWSYQRGSMANKTPGEVLFHLVDAVRLGGNFLLNVGPRPDGSLDDREKAILEPLGRWLKTYGQAIYGTKPEALYDLRLGRRQGPMFHYGMWTCKGSTGYLTLFYYPGRSLIVSKMGPQVLSAELMPDGRPLSVEPASNGRFVIGGLPDTCPDPLAAVIKVRFASPPYAAPTQDASWLRGEWALPPADSAARMTNAEFPNDD